MTRGSKERCFGLESLTGLAAAGTRSWSTVLGLLKGLKFVHLSWTKNTFVEGNNGSTMAVGGIFLVVCLISPPCWAGYEEGRKYL